MAKVIRPKHFESICDGALLLQGQETPPSKYPGTFYPVDFPGEKIGAKSVPGQAVNLPSTKCLTSETSAANRWTPETFEKLFQHRNISPPIITLSSLHNLSSPVKIWPCFSVIGTPVNIWSLTGALRRGCQEVWLRKAANDQEENFMAFQGRQRI